MTEKIDIPAVIFAGGQSKRMGEDKALLPFGSFNTLVEFQHNRLSEIFTKVMISWKSEKVQFGAESIFDKTKFSKISAPTIGLFSILESAESDYTFIISVDTPFFGKDEVKRLTAEIPNDFDVICPISIKGVEPLVAIYHKRVFKKIDYMIKAKNYKLSLLLQHLDTKYVKFEDRKAFINLNYQADYKRAVSTFS